jgi:hypothetical protein
LIVTSLLLATEDERVAESRPGLNAFRILTPDPAHTLRVQVGRRIRLRLGRWANRLGRITVRVADAPLGNAGAAKLSRVRVLLPASGKRSGGGPKAPQAGCAMRITRSTKVFA